jgi:hypothetical protein
MIYKFQYDNKVDIFDNLDISVELVLLNSSGLVIEEITKDLKINRK